MSETPHRLQPLLAPHSIAIVGASPREGSFGNDVIRVLLDGGYRGEWYPVNPNYDTVEGQSCYDSLSDLPAPVNLAIACVSGSRMEALFDDAIQSGVPALTVFDSCYVENDSAPALLQRLRSKAQDAGLLVCGGNGMGFYNFDARIHASFQRPMTDQSGAITLIAHSGSVFVLLANHDLRYRFNLVVSASQEIGCSVADYMDYALDQPSTRVITLFIETIRNPEGFRQALEKANDRNIPVVALKVGRTEESAKVATTHSGAIAGNDAAYEALFNHHGVIRAHDLDDLMAISAVLAQPISLGEGGVGAVTDSGGLCELLMDLAADQDLPFAPLSNTTVNALAKRLPHGLTATNPLDAAGSLTEDFSAVFRDCLSLILEDPAIALSVFEFEAQDRFMYMPDFIDIAKQAGKQAGKPVIALNSFAGGFNHDVACDLAEAGVAMVNGVDTCLRAVKGALAYRDFKGRPDAKKLEKPEPGMVQRWRTRLTETTSLAEHDSLALLSDFGIPTVVCRVAGSADQAAAYAHDTGFPVALKTAEQGIEHKSDVGGVCLNLDNEDQVRDSYARLSSSLGPLVTVQQMAAPGVEVSFGMIADEQFGPVVMVSAGGMMIELLSERQVALAPFDTAEAFRMINSLKLKKLLDGYRGAQASDTDALCHALSRFSVMIDSLSDVLESVDVNPVICGPDGCLAADALVIARQ